jgi:predicted metal-dependent hydrolase
VIVHELAHTKVPKHTDEFWRIVGGIMPDYKERIRLLRENAYRVKEGPI